MYNCEKCGSKYVLTTRTMDGEIVAILCTSCGFTKQLNKQFIKKIDNDYENFKPIEETQQDFGYDCFI